jgi:hypothetical protein
MPQRLTESVGPTHLLCGRVLERERERERKRRSGKEGYFFGGGKGRKKVMKKHPAEKNYLKKKEIK